MKLCAIWRSLRIGFSRRRNEPARWSRSFDWRTKRDATFGERVCVYVEPRPGVHAPDLDDVRTYLGERGVGKELWPEHLVVVDALPRASGGKIAKAELRSRARTETRA